MPDTARTPVFNRYEILEELGEGAFGAVYKARHRVMKRLVALKVLPPALRKDAETRERFEREAEALARLDHPHVVKIHDAEIEESFPYLAMEFVEGGDLRKVLQERKRLSVDEVIQLGTEMAQALDHVHQQGIVHRDVKPSNIMIGPNGHAKLTDFGIAFAARLPRITRGLLGTPEYMSPEQIDGTSLDGRSDLYSLGVLLYECLTGTPPFESEGDSMTQTYALLQRIQNDPVPPIHREDVPSWLADVIIQCLAKKPEDRYASGAALTEALRVGFVSEPDDTTPEADRAVAETETTIPEANTTVHDVGMAVDEDAVAAASAEPFPQQPPASPENENPQKGAQPSLDLSPTPHPPQKPKKAVWLAGFVALLIALLGGAYGLGLLSTTDDNALTPEETAVLQEVDSTFSLAGEIIQSGFSLAVVSFQTRAAARAEAERYRQRFSDQSIPVDVLPGKKGSVIWFRVAVGQASTRDEINALRERLFSNPDSAWVTRIVSSSTHTLSEADDAAPLTAEELRNLPPALRDALRNPMTVDALDLSENELTTVPEAITRLSNLKWLDLEANQLTTIPESVTRMTSLEVLNLRNNKLATVPEAITRLTNLKKLYLSENQLTTVPESITRMTGLEVLYLWGNKLTTVPESIIRMTSLEVINLSRNPLIRVPEPITRMTNLEVLFLGWNQLTTVPEAITRMINLKELYLWNNQLTTVPEAITRLTELRLLDLDQNQLTTTPASITQLTNLEKLFLSGNPISQTEQERIQWLLPNTEITF